MDKLLFGDTETTGLTPKHGIVQFAGIIEINGVIKEEFDILMAPHPKDEISSKALEINKRTEEELATFQSSFSGKKCIDETLCRHVNRFDKTDKMYFVGYNNGYDNMMLDAFYKKHGDKFWMPYVWYPLFDVAQQVGLHLARTGERCRLPNLKLGTVGKYLGLIKDESELHNAVADVKLTRDIFYVMLDAYGDPDELCHIASTYIDRGRVPLKTGGWE